VKEFHKVEDEDIFIDFCVDRELQPSTIVNYKSSLQKYCNFTNKTLDELITEAEYEEEAGIRLKRRKINKYLRDFKLSLKKSNLSERTIELTMLQTRAFYGHNEIELPRNNRKGVGKVQRQETIDDLPTMEEIKRFMEHLNSVYKAMTVVCLSSGMGASEVTSLTFKHLYKASSINPYPETIIELIEQLKAKGNFIPTWDIIRIKRNHPYTTLSSPESIDRIIIYLEELSHKYPDYKPEPEDKLFRGFKSNKPLKANDFSSIYANKNRKFSFRKTEDNRNVMRVHSLRKFFATTLESNEMPYLTTKRLLGHRVDSVDSAYFKTDIGSLKKDYMKVVKNLTIDKVKIVEINPYDEITEKVEDLSKKFSFVLEHGNLPKGILDYIMYDEYKEYPKEYAEYKELKIKDKS